MGHLVLVYTNKDSLPRIDMSVVIKLSQTCSGLPEEQTSSRERCQWCFFYNLLLSLYSGLTLVKEEAGIVPEDALSCLDGFTIVLGAEGDVIFVSRNITDYVLSLIHISEPTRPY